MNIFLCRTLIDGKAWLKKGAVCCIYFYAAIAAVVATAWVPVCYSPLVGSVNGQYFDEGKTEVFQTAFRSWYISEVEGQDDRYGWPEVNTGDETQRKGGSVTSIIVFSSGWPIRTMSFRTIRPLARHLPFAHDIVFDGALFPHKLNPVTIVEQVRALPLVPIFPEFLYSLALWLILLRSLSGFQQLFFRVRDANRQRQQRCRNCGYQIYDPKVRRCSECAHFLMARPSRRFCDGSIIPKAVALLASMVLILCFVEALFSLKIQINDAFVAVRKGDLESIRALRRDDPDILQAEIDPGFTFRYRTSEFAGYTIMMEAARYGRDDIIKYFIDEGFLASELKDGYWTPLAFAVSYGQVSTAKILLENGADPDQPFGRARLTARVVAMNYGSARMAELLAQYTAKDIDNPKNDASGSQDQ